MTLEDRLIAAVESGTVLDLAGEGRPDRAEMESWGPERTIEASLIREVLLGRKAPKADPHGIRLRGLRISGPLDLYNVQSDLDLSLSDCFVEGGVILRRARLRMVLFTRCRLLPGAGGTCLDGQQLVAASVSFENSIFDAGDTDGAINLLSARVGGPLNLSGARLNGHDIRGNSLRGSGLIVDGGMSLGPSGKLPFTSAGAISLPGARIRGQLDLSGAQLGGHDSDGDSLIAHGLIVDSDMFLRTSDKSPFTTAGAIRLHGAHIGGQLELSGAQLNGHDTSGNSLIGNGLTVDGDMLLGVHGESAFTAAGAVRLPRAHIRGQLTLSGAQLNGHDTNGYSLTGDGLTVDGGVFLSTRDKRAFTTTGAIRLPGAHIHGSLSLSGAQLNGHDTNGYSLTGDGLTVDGGVFLSTRDKRAFTTTGAIRLPGAHIHGQLALSGAQLNGHDANGNSLIGDGLTVDNGMSLGTGDASTFTAAGAVRLPGAHIHGPLALVGAQLNGHNVYGDSLIADGLIVDGDMLLGARDGRHFTVAGAIQLVRARILGQLQVPPSLLGSAGDVALSLAGALIGELSLDLARPLKANVQVDLQDATYASLSRLDDLDQWLSLLRHHTVAYTPQAYQQLATVHRAAGHERDARRILIAQQEDRRQRVLRAARGATRRTRFRFWVRRTGLWWFQKMPIGYGYRTWPAFVGVLFLAGIGAGLGIAAGHTHVGTTKQYAAYRPASAVRKVSQNCSIVEQAALGVHVPFLSSLGVGDCVLDTTSRAGSAYSVAIWTDQALAWAAATLAVAGYTGLVRRT